MDLAIEENDYPTQDMLRWFVNEQVEEEATMSHLVFLAEQFKNHTPLMIESHLPK